MTAPARTRTRGARIAVVFALLAITAVAALVTWQTSPRDGNYLDPRSTQPTGAHALLTLLRDQGVDVVVADTVGAAVAAADEDSLLLVTRTQYLPGEDLLAELDEAPGDRLIVEPSRMMAGVFAPGVDVADTMAKINPGCAMREADSAGVANLTSGYTYEQADDDITGFTSCYGGALVRYRDGGREVTVVGSANFMTNGQLLKDGNAALAMNLAGSHARVIWYAPQQLEGESSGDATIFDLIPERVNWIVWQLVLVVALLALWRGRRLGPLVAEQLPVVVRASETVEGRGRLYQSRRANDRAADALRTAALQRLLPRLGLTTRADPPQIVTALAARTGMPAAAVSHLLFGPAPATEDDLVHLASALDNIERQVAYQ